MKELSIFVDESGDFGEYNYHSPYYIITMVFHNQSDDISQDIHKFNSEHALLPEVEFRKVLPSDYRLFQVADLICTLELMHLKMERKTISKHELAFWGKESDFRKNYLKRLYQKEYVTNNR